ncbi:hypothetical protein FOZ60_000349 [Perkinsus olseni]|uniref:Integrase zinc-binding domain-containing protein n=1 Tax=Perkinsus olseni TaxID=32597 RepID=A0A7J6N0V1_PEROL|nr:hypothetical protein FOZ60_000349 [Perkinsus olseni]
MAASLVMADDGESGDYPWLMTATVAVTLDALHFANPPEKRRFVSDFAIKDPLTRSQLAAFIGILQASNPLYASGRSCLCSLLARYASKVEPIGKWKVPLQFKAAEVKLMNRIVGCLQQDSEGIVGLCTLFHWLRLCHYHLERDQAQGSCHALEPLGFMPWLLPTLLYDPIYIKDQKGVKGMERLAVRRLVATVRDILLDWQDTLKIDKDDCEYVLVKLKIGWRVYVPADIGEYELRDRLLQLAHDAVGHLVPLQMKNRLSRWVYWPGMLSDCEAFTRHCLSCDRERARHTPGPVSGWTYTDPSSGTVLHGCSVLLMVDGCSNYTELAVASDQTVPTLFLWCNELLILRFGMLRVGVKRYHDDLHASDDPVAITDRVRNAVNTFTEGWCSEVAERRAKSVDALNQRSSTSVDDLQNDLSEGSLIYRVIRDGLGRSKSLESYIVREVLPDRLAVTVYGIDEPLPLHQIHIICCLSPGVSLREGNVIMFITVEWCEAQVETYFYDLGTVVKNQPLESRLWVRRLLLGEHGRWF